MAEDIPAPPEADVIRLARLAGRLSVDDAVAKVRAAGGQVSATYWRDIERGHGGRRGQRVPARARDGLLAQMADAVGVTPDQLAEAGRQEAARVLEEMHRRESPAGDDYDSVTIDPTEKLAEDLDKFLPAVKAWARAARLTHPGRPLAGSDVFPPTMDMAIRYWDFLAARGMPQEELPTVVAVYLSRDEERARGEHRQGHGAAGLIRRRPAGRRPLAHGP